MKLILGLTSQSLNFLTVAVDFGLVSLNLLILPEILIFMSLQLVTDECARTEAQSSADRCPCPRVADGGADQSARGGAAQRADSGAFFTRR